MAAAVATASQRTNLSPPRQPNPASAAPPAQAPVPPPRKESSSPPNTPTNRSSESSSKDYVSDIPAGNFFTNFIHHLFKIYGEFCASQPWEVLVVVLVLLIGVLTFFNKMTAVEQAAVLGGDANAPDTVSARCNGTHGQDVLNDSHWVNTIALIGVSCMSVLHLLYRFKKIHRIGSYVILNICLTYITFTFVLFALVVYTAGGSNTRNFEDAWFLIPLLTDMQKVPRMAQIALCSSHSRRISENVAKSMYVLGPTFALDSFAKALFFGLGFWTGIPRLEAYSWYAIVSVLVNALVYLTFYPAGISVLVDLMFIEGRPKWDVRQIINTLTKEDSQSPVVHRVKVLTTAILLIIHICLAPVFFFETDPLQGSQNGILLLMTRNVEKVIMTILVMTFSLKYLFNEEIDEAREMRHTYIETLTRNFEEDSEQDGYKTKVEMDRASHSTDEGISIGSNKPRPPSSRGNDDSSSESAWSEVDMLPELKDQEIQTAESMNANGSIESFLKTYVNRPSRSVEECKEIMVQNENSAASLTDDEVLQLLKLKILKGHTLESVLGNLQRGVNVRRRHVERLSRKSLDGLPSNNFDYQTVMGACCESVIGYMTLPVGVAGPLKLDDQLFQVPMATTEGCLVASVNRGCRALSHCGVKSFVTNDGMTRGPIVRFPNVSQMAAARAWISEPRNFAKIKAKFDSTSRFARLQKLKLKEAGRELYIRFVAKTGDAMGMNMLSKATEFSLVYLKSMFPDMILISLSGNFCTDKKPAAINWIDGRGKSVICEAVVPAEVITTVLKTSAVDLADLNKSKNLVGSAMAGSIGGFNAQAANVVTAVFIATGQDAAQNVASSNCLTQMDVLDDGDLYMTVTMPSIEVGTVGGGTILKAQGTCLDMLGVKGSHPTSPGDNAIQLARVVCATVLAGELSLMSALAAGHLVKSHLRHNRSQVSMGACPANQPPSEEQEQAMPNEQAETNTTEETRPSEEGCCKQSS